MSQHYHAKRIWTAEEDAELQRLLIDRTPTSVLAVQFKCCQQSMRKHIRDIGLTPAGWSNRRQPGRAERAQAAASTIPLSRCQNWWPLPAGSPESWSAISDVPWPGPRV